MKRTDLINYLAKIIIEYKKEFPVLVGINGVDASGKTVLASDLAGNLKQSDCSVISASIDYFHNPKRIRYSKGRDSAEGYYFDSFNYEAVKNILLNPLSSGDLRYKLKFFDYRTESNISSPVETASKDSILIMEGIFLFCPELADYWDIKIFLDIDFDTAVERAVKRTAEIEHIGSEQEIRKKFEKRYIPGQQIYFREANPKEKADIIIDNNDFENPVLIIQIKQESSDNNRVDLDKENQTAKYIHGTTPEEQKRLTLLNKFLNERSLSKMDFRGGEKILDVGSGLGQFSRLMARTVGENGSVVGIERDAKQLAEARRQAAEDGEEKLVKFRQGDAFDFPLADNEWGTFDVAHTRFLLEHVSEPLDVVRSMVRAIRPDGGRVILQDDNHDTMRLYPEIAEFDEVWEAYYKTYEILGNDPFIGHKLISLLHKAGAKPVKNDWIFFGSCQGDENFDYYVENIIGVLDGAKQAITGKELLSENKYTAGIEALKEWQNLPDAAIWFSLSYAEGKRAGN